MKKTNLLVMLLSAISFLVGCNTISKFNIMTSVKGVNITPNVVTNKVDYKGTIKVGGGVQKILPDEVDSVILGNNTRTDIKDECTYTLLNEKEATLEIPGDIITANITVNLKTTPPIPPGPIDDPTFLMRYRFHQGENKVKFAVTAINEQPIEVDWGDGAKDTKIVSDDLTYFEHTFYSEGEFNIEVGGKVGSALLAQPEANEPYFAKGNQHIFAVAMFKEFTQAVSRRVSTFGGYRIDDGFNSPATYSNLELVYIGEDVRNVPVASFQYCRRLINLNMSKGVKNILSGAFMNTGIINRVIIPYTVENIESEAFAHVVHDESDVYTLESVNFQNVNPNFSQLKMIGDSAFMNTNIETLIIPKSVERIQNRAFSSCAKLEFCHFEEDSNLKFLGTKQELTTSEVFKDTTQLYNIYLPDSLADSDSFIGKYTFHGWTAQQRIFIPIEKNAPIPAEWSIEWDSGSAAFVIYDHDSWYKYRDWWNYCSNGVPGEEATTEDIGKTASLIINGVKHIVRLIGVNQDETATGDTIRTTFEFVTPICDTNGNSLATQWNDAIGIQDSNANYINSSIRVALNGNKDGTENVMWAQKSESLWSNDYNKSVYSMLPEYFAKMLKAPTKYVACSGNGWTHEAFNDKLFLLTPREMGYDSFDQEDKQYTSPYSYYDGHTDALDSIRIKKQANEEYFYPQFEDVIKIKPSERQLYKEPIENYAGYYYYDDESFYKFRGSLTWLRSPETSSSWASWGINEFGQVIKRHCPSCALSVAPAFCI